MDKVDGRMFWLRVDRILADRNVTMTDFMKWIGVKKSTLYKQRERHQIPKSEQLSAMEKLLGVSLLSTELGKFNEYIPYLEKAEEWQLKAVREILKMPESKKDSGSISQVS